MRKTLILLALAVMTTASVGCGCCRNLFRRGSPCFGTSKVAPAMIGAPMALAAPVAAPVPLMQRVAPQVVMPRAAMPQPACCPPVCEPCDSCGGQEWLGGYVEGAQINDGGCQNCGPTTNYDQGYLIPSTESPQSVVPEGSGARTDPGPSAPN